MEQGRLALTQRDRDRLTQLRAVVNGDLRVGQAARRLRLSRRQVRRLLRRIEREGDRGVIHRLRGRASNRRIGARSQERALSLLSQPVYRDFGPTLAAEHLARAGIQVSRETLRRWMSGAGLWRPRRQRIEAVYTWRERRAAFGELVLMDTSEHDWLERRGPRLSLVAMIDDATDRVFGRFVEHDTAEENLRTLKGWLERHGRPLALYTDRDSIFLTTRPHSTEEVHGPAPPTSFAQALEELGIEWIAASSPQAKGRVERLFETLQDRLVKELRVAGVTTLVDANRFLEEVFLPQYQQRFTHAPRAANDAHRSIKGFDLASVLCLRQTRVVTGDYTLSLGGRRLLIQRRHVVPGLRKSRVLVEQRLDGSFWVRFRAKRLPLQPLPAPAPVAASPSRLRPPGLAAKPRSLRVPPKPKPSKHHPWRQPWKRSLLLCRQADISTLR